MCVLMPGWVGCIDALLIVFECADVYYCYCNCLTGGFRLGLEWFWIGMLV